MFYKVVLTFLVLAALSVNILAAPTSLRARAGGEDNGRKPKTVKNPGHRLGQVYQALTQQQNKPPPLIWVTPLTPDTFSSTQSKFTGWALPSDHSKPHNPGYVTSSLQGGQVVEDAARERQQQIRPPSPQGQESGFIASHKQWEKVVEDAARERQKQSQPPSPQSQPSSPQGQEPEFVTSRKKWEKAVEDAARERQQQSRPPSPQGEEPEYVTSRKQWEKVVEDAARERQQQSQPPSPQGQPPYNPPKPHNPRRLPGM